MGKSRRRPTKEQAATPRLLEAPEQEGPEPKVPGGRSEAREREDFTLSIMYCLTAPFIGYPGWGEDPGFWALHKDRITIQRLAHGVEIHQTKMATEYEAMLYVSSATLAHPPSERWYRIYMWLFRRWNPEAADANGFAAHDLDPQELEELAGLRRWLYRRQMEHVKAKLRQGEGGESDATPKAPDLVQAEMF